MRSQYFFPDGAGVDTTLAAITRFVVNMMLHPEIQRRAQEEIDACTGGHRLPNLGECVLMFLSSVTHDQCTEKPLPCAVLFVVNSGFAARIRCLISML